MSYSTVSVTTSATLILAANSDRHSYIITNTNSANKLYIGPTSSVTTANGTEIPASGSITEDTGGVKMYCGPIYGIAATTIDVRYWERTERR